MKSFINKALLIGFVLSKCALCAQPKAADLLANLPLTFEENRGQWDSHVLFGASQPWATTFIRRDGVTWVLGSGTQKHSVSLSIQGASGNALVAGEADTGSISNYLTGPDRKHWATGIHHFERVRMADARGATDLLFYSNRRNLEYDLIVKPNTDPDSLTLSFNGADRLYIDPGGDLIIQTSQGDLVQHKPSVWQSINGVRHQVDGAYVLGGRGLVTVRVGEFDHSRDLVIDPIVSFSTYLGGSQQNTPYDISVDGSGNAFICGGTFSADFPTTIGAFRTSLTANIGNAFVTKLNAQGSGVIYSTYLGGSAYAEANSIAIDASGTAYIAGSTFASDFPFTSGAYSSQQGQNGAPVLFVAKLNPAGNMLTYATSLGLTTLSGIARIRVDVSGAAYVAGSTKGFPVTSGAFSTTLNLGNSSSLSDAFLAKLSPNGDSLIYATYLGGSDDDFATGLVIDSQGRAYVSGITLSRDLPTTPGAFQRSLNTTAGSFSGFITFISASGSSSLASTYLGGTASSGVYSLAVDAASSIYATGDASSGFPTTSGAYSRTPPAAGSANYVAKLDSALANLVFSTFLGPAIGSGIAVDSHGSVIVAGATSSPGYPITAGSLPGYTQGAYLTKLSADGSTLTYSTIFGLGGTTSRVTGLALDSSGNAFLIGTTSSTSMPTTPNAFQRSNLENCCSNPTGYVEKIDLNSSTLCTIALSAATITLPPGGSTGTIAVTVPDGCPWQALGADFVSLNQASGVGSGSFSYTAQPNSYGYTGSATRTSTISVGPVHVTLSQVLCSYSLGSGSLQLRPVAGIVSVPIFTAPGCEWSAGSGGLSWLAVSPFSGSGTANITLTYAANGSTTRSGSVYIANKDLSVTQLPAGASVSPGPVKVGVMQPQYSTWALDVNGNGLFDSGDRYFSFLTLATDVAVVGDWTGDGHAKVGVYRNGYFALDLNNNGVWDGPSGGDSLIALGGVPGDIPVVGDWNGDGRTKVGIYRHGFWILDTNGDGVFGPGDQFLAFGGNPNEQPVVGDWNGDGRTKIGIMYNGTWVLDIDGSGTFDAADKVYHFPYASGDKPLVGDWDGTHITKIGIYRNGFWIIDYNGNGVWDGPAGGDKLYAFGGIPGEIPIIGDWNGDGKTKIGLYIRGFWYQDYNGNGMFDGFGVGQDRFFAFGGSANEQPVVGAW